MTTVVTRADLQSLQGINPKLLRAFEELFVGVATAGETAAGAVAATGALQDAAVLTASPNAAFGNERVLQVLDGLTLDLTENGAALLSLVYLITVQGGFKLAFNVEADSSLDLPVSGRVAALDAAGATYADDAAAAAAGVKVGDLYRKPAGVVAWRVV